jgi:hypothetical protein
MLTFSHILDRVRVTTPQSSGARVSHDATFEPNNVVMFELNDVISEPNCASRVSRWISRISPKLVCAMLCAVAAIVSGCAASQKPRARAFPWATANTIRPLAPAKASFDVSNADLFADLGVDVPGPPSIVGGAPSGPPRPRVAVVPSGGGSSSRPPEVPMIAPQLSPEQTATAQQQTSASVNVAQKNIAAAQGRSLNAMQSDLASKVRSFLAEAREAAQLGDWTRASSAAKKAEVLSEELAGSL